MADVVQMQDRSGSFLVSIEIWRRPDGSLSARPVDMPTKLMEADGLTPAERVRQIAAWTKVAAEALEREAGNLE